MVDKIGHERCESPVVRAVLEQVANGHGGVRKSMDKDRLQKTLCVVEGMASSSVFDYLFHWLISRSSAVNDLWSDVEKEVDKQRSSIFSEEDSAPADLRSKIFEVEFSVNTEILQLFIVFQRLSFLIKSKTYPTERLVTKKSEVKNLPFDVVFGMFLCDASLYICNCGMGLQSINICDDSTTSSILYFHGKTHSTPMS